MGATFIDVPIPPQESTKVKDRPKLTIEDQIKHMRDVKGIKFGMRTESG